MFRFYDFWCLCPRPLPCVAVPGACRRVPDEARVGPEAVPHPERLSFCERRHQPPEPAAALPAGRMRQETHLAARRDRRRPVRARGRILLLQVQVGSYLPPSHRLPAVPYPAPCAPSPLPFTAAYRERFCSTRRVQT